jgi:hypothetical protein
VHRHLDPVFGGPNKVGPQATNGTGEVCHPDLKGTSQTANAAALAEAATNLSKLSTPSKP